MSRDTADVQRPGGSPAAPRLHLRPGFRHLLAGRPPLAPPPSGGGDRVPALQPFHGCARSERRLHTALGGEVTLFRIRWAGLDAGTPGDPFPEEVVLTN